MIQFLKKSWQLPTLIIVFLLIYFKTLFFDFVWDDLHAIVNNPYIKGSLIDGLFRSLHEQTQPGIVQHHFDMLVYDSFRPLLFLSNWLEHQIFGLNPLGYHLVSLIWGVIFVSICFVFSKEIFKSKILAFLTCLFVVIHPMYVEVFAYISGRSDVMASSLTLLSFLFFIRRKPFLAALLYVVALACKEAYIGLPAVLLVYCLVQGSFKERWKSLCIVFGALVFYLLVRSPLHKTGLSSGAAIQAFLFFPDMFVLSLKKIFLPFDLSTLWPYEKLSSVGSWIFFASLGCVVLVGGIQKIKSELLRAVGFLVSAFLFFAPSAMGVLLFESIADRYFLLPALFVWIAVLVAAKDLLRRAPKWKPLVVGVGACWALLLLVSTWVYSDVWQNNKALFAFTLEMQPQHPKAHYSYGLTFRSGSEERFQMFSRAAELGSKDERVFNKLGLEYVVRGKYELAETQFKKALKMTKAMDPDAWFNIGIARAAMGKTEDACRSYRNAVFLVPKHERANQEILNLECPDRATNAD